MSRNIGYKNLDSLPFMCYFLPGLERKIHMQRKNVKKVNLSRNLKLYYAAIGIIILGYIFLSIGDANSFTSITLGPIILVLGYIVVVPIALLSGSRKKVEDSESKKIKNSSSQK